MLVAYASSNGEALAIVQEGKAKHFKFVIQENGEKTTAFGLHEKNVDIVGPKVVRDARQTSLHRQ
jgi:hypothetical protein